MHLAGNSLVFAASVALCDASGLLPGFLSPRASNTSGYTSDIANVYDALANHPNATGAFDTIGFDMTRPYSPDSSNQTGWQLEVRVAANVSYNGGYYGDNWQMAEQVRSNPTQIRLKAPEDAFGNRTLDPGWSTCVFMWFAGMNDLETTKHLQNDDDGSCGGLISDACLTSLRNMSATNGRCLPHYGFGENDVCSDYLFYGNNLYPAGSNDTVVTNTSGPYPFYSQTYPINLANDTTNTSNVYDYVTTNVWPVLINYHYTDGKSNHSFTDLRCLRARNITEGSRHPDGFGIRPANQSVNKAQYAHDRNEGGRSVMPALGQVVLVGVVVVAMLL